MRACQERKDDIIATKGRLSGKCEEKPANHDESKVERGDRILWRKNIFTR